MFKLKIAIIVVVGCFVIAIHSPAQTTNIYPLTVLEAMESTTGQVVVKGTAPVGNISFGSTLITAVCKEDYFAPGGEKHYGILVDLKSSGVSGDATIVDYDELDSLLHAVDSVSKADWSLTPLSSFSIGYTTKAGLRIAGFSSKRTGAIQFALHGSHFAKGIPLSPDQLSKFYDLLAQSKAQIEQLRKGITAGQN